MSCLRLKQTRKTKESLFSFCHLIVAAKSPVVFYQELQRPASAPSSGNTVQTEPSIPQSLVRNAMMPIHLQKQLCSISTSQGALNNW